NGTVIFGGTGQNDIIGGNSDMFSLITPAQRPDSGKVMIFAGAGTEIGRNDSQSTATVGGAATQNDVLSLTITWVSPADGSSKSATATYTVQTNDSLANMVAGLLASAQGNSTLTGAGFSFGVSGNVLTIDSTGAYSVTGAVTGAKSETLAIAEGGAT